MTFCDVRAWRLCGLTFAAKQVGVLACRAPVRVGCWAMARQLAVQAGILWALIATVAVLPGAAAQSSCRIQLVGSGARLTGPTATANAVRSGSVRCTGAAVEFTGPIALRGVATFSGEPASCPGWATRLSAALSSGKACETGASERQ